MREPSVKVEVWELPSRYGASTFTAVTETPNGGGHRLCGIKLYASGSVKIAEFRLDRRAVDALVADIEIAEEEAKGVDR